MTTDTNKPAPIAEPASDAALRFAIDWLDKNRGRVHAADCSSREPSAQCSCGLHRVLSGLRQTVNDAEAAALGSCAECGKTSTPNSMWALYCVECIEHKIAPAMAAPAVDERTADADSVDLAAASNGSPGGAPDVDSLRGLDTPTRVRFYEHDFYVLSNFSAFTLYWRGLRFDTSEAAYHFEKFPTYPRIRERIKNAPSAHEAFKIAEAEKHMRRPDWDDVKVSIMRNLLREKAKQHEYVRRKLLATGDRELVEDSWRDDFWGWGPNRDGQNMLGKLWMEVRAELRSAAVSPDAPAK